VAEKTQDNLGKLVSEIILLHLAGAKSGVLQLF
jgi:hypothetical protein